MRGRGKKVEEKELVEPAVEVEEKEESTSKPKESSSQRRRGRKTKESPTPTSTEASSSPLEDPASPTLKAAAKPTRGAKKGKAKVERVAAADIPEPSADPCGTCKKAKRGITWDCQVEGGEISEEEAAVPAPVAVVEQPKRGGRRRRCRKRWLIRLNKKHLQRRQQERGRLWPP